MCVAKSHNTALFMCNVYRLVRQLRLVIRLYVALHLLLLHVLNNFTICHSDSYLARFLVLEVHGAVRGHGRCEECSVSLNVDKGHLCASAVCVPVQ